MAALGEIPFGRYYGSVDATPLFVLLAGAYHRRTGDRAFIETLAPNIDRALEWIERHGDADGDGFVEYHRRSGTGLLHQGWKDSPDPVSHADGRLAESPIALAEVQAYVYGAWREAARIRTLLGDGARASECAARAERVRERFEERFWCESMGAYAIGLDHAKQPCRVLSSNAGQVLLTGLARPDRARCTADRLLGDDACSGFGIRTLAAGERRYNPMSYHNGSIWPHDNALIAAGFARYGLTGAAGQLLDGLLDASTFLDLHRMPELLCGFARRAGEGPTLYPVACAPQAWAAGAVFLLLQASLGLGIDAPGRRLCCTRPFLPAAIDWVEVRGLVVGDASLDLRFERHRRDVSVVVLAREGDIEIVSVK
jgi:glycogen debranching enzyme